MALDIQAGEPTLWIVGRQATIGLAEQQHGGTSLGSLGVGWDARGIRLIRRREGQWAFAADFGAIARRKVPRTTPPQFSRIRLYVNPADPMLYIAEEQTGVGKSFYSVLRCDPETGRMKEVKFPFDPEDIAFDLEGLAYFRTDREVVRFQPKDWREVPWDYGEVRQNVGFDASGSTPSYDAVAALAIPGHRPVWWSSSGMAISPRRHLAITCNIPDRKAEANPKDRRMPAGAGKKYTPMLYPGRAGVCVVPIFDEHGKVLIEDAVPGMTNADGIGMDREGNLYVMVAASRLMGGKRVFDPTTETLMKFRPGKAKFVSSSGGLVPLPDEMKPDRPADIYKYGMGDTWVEGAEWMYGGVGYGGQGGSCVCWHSRFQLDDFARSFVPEVLRYNVAVLDSNGNVILRIGRYGNVDDGEPLVRDGGPAQPRSIGGDEVALAHAAYVGVHTDRRLYIHDAGNARILSVKLGYHVEEKVALNDVPDSEKR